MVQKNLKPKMLFDSTPLGFSQVVISEPGQIVNISGQVAWNEHGELSASGLEGQFRKALDQVIHVVNLAGGSIDDIQILRIYIPNFRPENTNVIASILVDVFGDDRPPASSWIGVNSLAQKDYLIEVEAMAIIPIHS